MAYRCGLVVTVNLNPVQPWTVAQAGRQFELPPFGWVVSRGPSEAPAVLAYSAVVGGQRLDYVACPDYFYLNSGDKRRRTGPLEVIGAAWAKREAEGWQIIPCGKLGYWSAAQRQQQIPADRGCPLLIVDPAALPNSGPPARPASKPPQPVVTAVDETGGPVPAVVSGTANGRLQLQVTQNTHAFHIRNGGARKWKAPDNALRKTGHLRPAPSRPMLTDALLRSLPPHNLTA